jgi:hypothetical protein
MTSGPPSCAFNIDLMDAYKILSNGSSAITSLNILKTATKSIISYCLIELQCN